MTLTWLAVAARDGGVISDLPDLAVDTVKQTIGRYETAQGSLPVSLSSEATDWQRATKPYASFLVLCDDNPSDPTHGVPLWGGMVTRRRLKGDKVEVDLASAEVYATRRYVGTETFTGVDQNLIAKYLVENYLLEGANGKQGIPIRVAIVGSAGPTHDRHYLDQDDKTLYSLLQDLSGIQDGIEWTMGFEWQYSPERLTLVFYVGSRIGTSPLPGLAPAATFETPGNASDIEMLDDYGVNAGANDVMATSSGQGTARPQSSRAIVVDADRPTVETRFSPSTSINDVARLDDYASRAVAAIGQGTKALAFSASVEKAPRLGIQWSIGDDIGFEIPEGTVPTFPQGLKGSARAYGWERTLTGVEKITPILVSDSGAFDD
jgi:hypothetical protein